MSDSGHPDELRDQLPDDLNASEYVGPYQFPDNSRRRRPAVIYAVVGLAMLAAWLGRGDGPSVLVNRGYLLGAVLFLVISTYMFSAGWRMRTDERQALVAAQGAVGFPVGHASAQQVWRGLRSRPTWRVLVYSTENPPRQRGLVLVDAIDGSVVEHLSERNPEEDWPDEG